MPEEQPKESTTTVVLTALAILLLTSPITDWYEGKSLPILRTIILVLLAVLCLTLAYYPSRPMINSFRASLAPVTHPWPWFVLFIVIWGCLAASLSLEVVSLRKENAELKQYKDAHEREDWPTLTADKQQTLLAALKQYPSSHQLLIICADAECRELASQIDFIALNTGWTSKIMGTDNVSYGLHISGSRNQHGQNRVEVDDLAMAFQKAIGYPVTSDAAQSGSEFTLVIGRYPGPGLKLRNGNP